MSDRYNALLVVLDRDVTDYECQPLIDAIMQMKGVVTVTGNVADIGAHIAENRVKMELQARIWDVITIKDNRK